MLLSTGISIELTAQYRLVWLTSSGVIRNNTIRLTVSGKKMHAMSKNRFLLVTFVILLIPLLSWAADRPLFTFDQGLDPKSVQSRDAKIAIAKSADG